MSNSLEERLKAHSNAFDGLLSLIPAKHYYDEDTQDQWQKKKKTKEELKNNKKIKLDPTLAKASTAKGEHEQRSKNAKPVVIPGSKNNSAVAPGTEEDADDQDDEESDDESVGYGSEEIDSDSEGQTNKTQVEDEGFIKEDDDLSMVFNDDGDLIQDKQTRTQEIKQIQKEQTKKGKKSKELSEEEKREKEERMAKLREKLASKITSMKAKRKAPGSNVPGSATSREQILEERRRKEETRKKRTHETTEEDEDDSSSDEDNEDIETKTTSEPASSVLFGNIEFADGDKVTSDLKSFRKVGKKKGPAHNDIKAHLKNIEKENARIANMDEDKKKNLLEKNQWSKALNSVQGIKNKDDEKLLKKALRRKESKKRKSEREWAERKQIVADTIKKKQDRREENLRIRRDNKGKPKNKQEKHVRAFKGSVKPKRAGFEGRLKSGKGKKN